MANRVELIFDFVSPNAYLIWWPLRDVVKRTGAELDITPVASLEMRRFIAKHGLTKFKLHPKFPFNSISLQRLLVAADQDGRALQFIEAMLPAVWEEGVDITDPETLAKALADAGFDAADLMARIQTDEVKQKVFANTEAAVERGAFGIPTMYVGPKDGETEMFFGKERLGQVEELLAEG